MGAWRWFAAVCASVGAASAVAADGLELSAKSRAFARGESAEGAAFVATPAASPVQSLAPSGRSLPFLGGDPMIEHALNEERDHALARSGCRMGSICYDAAEGRMMYRGARRYMPAWPGLAPEGISLRRDRVTLRYSFR